jgi:hypothetical protein
MFDNVYLVKDKLETVPESEVLDLEKSLNIKTPAGYLEFITKLGIGEYCGLIRIYEPAKILQDYKEAQKRWKEYYFWDRGETVLPKEKVLQSIVFGDSIDSDEIIYFPEQPNRLFVLPRQDNTIYWIEGCFANLMDWQSEDGAVRERSPEEIESFASNIDSRFKEFSTNKSDFEDIKKLFPARWSESEIHKVLDEEEAQVLLIRAIGGAIQLTTGDPFIDIRIDYDKDKEREVKAFIKSLK